MTRDAPTDYTVEDISDDELLARINAAKTDVEQTLADLS